MASFELPSRRPPTLKEIWADLDRHSLTHGITAWLMACTGPFAVLLGVAVAGGMSARDISSWIFGGYGVAGLLSIAFSYLYRMPMGLAWTIPGVVLLGGALDTLPFNECIGAFYASALLITVLGVTGWVGRIAQLLPLNIVMAMVAGVFLPFVLKIVTAFPQGPLVATATVTAFVAFSGVARLARILPPIFAAILAGAIVIVATGQLELTRWPGFELVRPIIYQPAFSWRAIGALTAPLTITVVGIHNLQGFAIARENGFAPPSNVLTTACGVGSFVYALVGTVPACVTGPANGILNTSGAHERRYVGGIVFGVLMLLFGLFAPVAAAVAFALPAAFIGLIGGLAIFHVLRSSFRAAFGGRLSVGALVTFVITLAGVPIASIGAPFWAVIFGVVSSYVFERDEWRARDDPTR